MNNASCGRVILAVLLLCVAPCSRASAKDESPQYVRPDPETGASQAVIVNDDALIHTSMVYGPSLEPALESLNEVLAASRSDLSRLVKLNVYASTPMHLATARRALAKRMRDLPKPAVCWVVSSLPGNAAVAVDAVAMTDRPVTGVVRVAGGTATISPGGSRIYISGQAAQAMDIAAATRQTLDGLQDTLHFLKREKGDVLQLKAFLSPMSKSESVMREIETFFGRESHPPVVLVEWQSAPSVPIEIELVVWGGAGEDQAEPVEYLTPPGMKSSPVFSRVARIHRTPAIYLSSQTATGRDAAEEVRQAFDALERVLAETGSDLQHLVKATYYVADDEISRELGTLRTKLYAADRPPAASKANVAVVGTPDRRFVMDMIAVPAPTENAGPQRRP